MARREQEYPANRFRIEYGSPFLERPTPEWIEKTRKNFNWDKFKDKSFNGPEPSVLPMPSDRLLNKKARKLMLYKKYHQNQHSKAAFHKIFFLKKLKNKINTLLLKYQYFYLSY